jgi:hypothetical protein
MFALAIAREKYKRLDVMEIPREPHSSKNQLIALFKL